MATAAQDGREFIDIGGTQVETFIVGSGPDVLFLHGGLWLGDESGFMRELSRHARVIAPMHPGFGASAQPGANLANADDLAYFYFDLIDKLGLKKPVIAGASFGGWIAAEMGVKSAEMSGLVLVDALGIRPGAPTDRTIADIFGIRDSELVKLAYKNPPDGADNLRGINDDDELRRRLRARDALAYYGWQPYMHNPQLQSRLHRVKAPPLVLWGDSDGIVSPD